MAVERGDPLGQSDQAVAGTLGRGLGRGSGRVADHHRGPRRAVAHLKLCGSSGGVLTGVGQGFLCKSVNGEPMAGRYGVGVALNDRFDLLSGRPPLVDHRREFRQTGYP